MAERGRIRGFARILIPLVVLNLGASPETRPDMPWAFRPVSHPAVPEILPQTTNPIDAFLAERFAVEGIHPTEIADRRTLLRRLTFDLIGLPPTPEEVAAFELDVRPAAYERLVDRLLADPRYGERWGRHWLDLVRYAETHGYERDDAKPDAWRYRDWVIEALNRDMPYDQFVLQQLAGDELPDASIRSKVATGMFRLGPIDDEPADPVMDRYDQLDDMIKTIGTTFLGLTIHCARCHDHKFDPIQQSDYYRMLAFLTPSKPFVRDDDSSISVTVASDGEQRRVADFRQSIERQVKQLQVDLTTIADVGKEGLNKRLSALVTNKPIPPPQVLGLTDTGPVSGPTALLIRGDAHRPGATVNPGFLSIVTSTSPTIVPPASGRSTGRRLALARWIVRPDHPLTSRVIVNRLWQHHFGQGLVETPSDFGAMGEEPSHPALLDWLASEFVARGWSWKGMHRLMVTSDAYRRCETRDAALVAADPENRTFARRPSRRLEAEPIRDAVLAVSGNLQQELFGPSIRPKIDATVLAGQSRPGSGWAVSAPREANRRSIYVLVKRTLGVPELELFDAADNNEPCPRRAVTTTSPQALMQLNSGFYHEQAAHFADRLLHAAGADLAPQVDHAFQLAFGRHPNSEESAAGLRFLQSEISLIAKRKDAGGVADPRSEALAAFCLVLLNTNEFVTID